ncbi:DUF742 domain-containing protein [Streptomyces sp. NPDC002851]
MEPTRNTLALETLVISAAPNPRTDATDAGLPPEAAEILALCRRLLSVAEVAAHVRLPITVVKVLLADLVDAGLVWARPPIPVSERPDKALLKEVLDGLRRL